MYSLHRKYHTERLKIVTKVKWSSFQLLGKAGIKTAHILLNQPFCARICIIWVWYGWIMLLQPGYLLGQDLNLLIAPQMHRKIRGLHWGHVRTVLTVSAWKDACCYRCFLLFPLNSPSHSLCAETAPICCPVLTPSDTLPSCRSPPSHCCLPQLLENAACLCWQQTLRRQEEGKKAADELTIARVTKNACVTRPHHVWM